jgi:hypothetical protein
MNYKREISAISDLIMSATIMQEIRNEVTAVLKEGFVVTDGSHCDMGEGYDVVVKCGSKDRPDVGRRIKGSFPDVEIEKIADGVIGIKTARRMRGMKGE